MQSVDMAVAHNAPGTAKILKRNQDLDCLRW